jgi:hypothetical protein
MEVIDYLKIVTNRLENNGFRVHPNVTFRHNNFLHVASSTTFRFSRGGLFNRKVVFSNFGKPNIQILKSFSSDAFRFTNRTYGLLPPRGFGYSTQCFAVAIVDSVKDSVIQAVEKYYPKRHFAASEIIVIFDRKKQNLHYYKTNPQWGALYHEENRSFIEAILIPKVTYRSKI